jgi:glutathione peroxidase
MTAQNPTGAVAAPVSFFDFRVTGIVGEPDLLGPLRGRVVLAVNVASRCGYTPQYSDLQRLHEENAPYGFSVVGFPCNQFGSQEPGTDAEIRDFCSTHYDVTFPLAARLEVNGPGRHPLYAWLCAGHGPASPAGDIHWNFEKFLIDRTGRVVARFPSGTRPFDAGLLAEVAELVGETGPGERGLGESG